MLKTHTHFSAGALAVGCTVLLAAVTWGAAHTPPTTDTPLQVADTLDSIVQSRFQTNAGRFGVDRVIIQGHDNIYDLDVSTPGDRARLSRVKQARRPFIVAFLHCVHKPGQNVGDKHPVALDKDFKPSLDVLATGSKTEARADKLFEWGSTHLAPATLPRLPELKRGRPQQAEDGNWLVVMRPVHASRQSCLGCHEGARRGDTLGVMVYAVDKNIKDPIRDIEVSPNG